ncbi:hypothetical protein TNCV_3139221 [Trichonephila clavipes]|nr:hypothetical protein TNCV_3139221 [Trichonephila clavipes]
MKSSQMEKPMLNSQTLWLFKLFGKFRNNSPFVADVFEWSRSRTCDQRFRVLVTMKTLQCRGARLMHVKSVEVQRISIVKVWKLGEGSANLCVDLVIIPDNGSKLRNPLSIALMLLCVT